VRMEAYRRLAAVTEPADVEDIRTEWVDRYGPLPPSADALLEVARLRAECVRLGIETVTVQRGIARLTGLGLAESEKVRLRRLAPGAVAKDTGELAIPIAAPGEQVASRLTAVLDELRPRRPNAAA